MIYDLKTKNEERKTKNQAGQTLLEVVVALSVGILIVSAIVVSVINALNNEQFGVSQNQATQIAQDGLNIFWNLSQSDWDTFKNYGKTNGGAYCLPQPNPTPVGTDAQGNCAPNAGDNNKYTRALNIVMNACITPTPGVTDISGIVTSTVKWSDSKCPSGTPNCHQTQVVSCMFKPITNTGP